MIIYIYDDKNNVAKEFHVDSKTAKAVETLLKKADYPNAEVEGKIKFVDNELED